MRHRRQAMCHVRFAGRNVPFATRQLVSPSVAEAASASLDLIRPQSQHLPVVTASPAAPCYFGSAVN